MELQNTSINEERIGLRGKNNEERTGLRERNHEAVTFVNTDRNPTIALPEAPIQEISNLPPKETRIYLFDLARLFASVMVVLHHYEIHYEITAYGCIGVQFFFILSGFVISMSAEGKSFGEFITARLKRILPGFWICCTLLYIVHLNFKCQTGNHRDMDFDKYIKNMFFLSKLTNTPYMDGVYWTLYIEVEFYLLVAFLLLFKNWRLYMDITMFVILVRTWHHFLTITGDWYMGPETGDFLQQGWALALGSAFAGCVVSKARTKLNWLSLIIGVPLLFYCLWFDALWRINKWRKPMDTKVVMQIAGAMTLFFFVVPCFRFKLGKEIEKIVLFLGGVSYPLYLFHSQLLFEFQAQQRSIDLTQKLTVIPVAFIIHQCLEKPFVSLITRFLKTKTTRTEAMRTEATGTETTGTERRVHEAGRKTNTIIAINSNITIN